MKLRNKKSRRSLSRSEKLWSFFGRGERPAQPRPRMRRGLQVESLEDRRVLALTVGYAGAGNPLTLSEVGATSDTVTVTEPAADTLRINLGAATFDAGSSLAAGLTYQVAGNPAASNFVDVSIAAAGAVSTLNLNLGANADTLNIQTTDNNGVTNISINMGAGADVTTFTAGGVSIPGNLTINSETVTQAGPIIGTGLELLGAGPFTLTSATNNVTTLAANTTGTISYRDANALTVGTVNTVGITTLGNDVQLQAGTTLLIDDDIALGAGDLGINVGSGATQNAGDNISAAGLALTGFGEDLFNAGNSVTTFAANTSDGFNYSQSSGFTVGSVTVLAATTTGVTSSDDDVLIQSSGGGITIDDDINLGAGDLLLNAAGAVTQGAGDTITAAGLYLGLTAAAVGPYTLTDPANDVATLAANAGGAIDYRDANSLAVGTVNVAGNIATGITTTADNTTIRSGGALTLTDLINVGAATVSLTVDDGGLIDGNGATNNVTATNLLLVIDDGVGSGANPIETTVSTLDVTNTSTGGIFVVNSGALQLGNLGGPNARSVNGIGGAGFIRATSPLTIAANAITSGGMTYTAGDSAAAGDDLTVNTGVTVQDTTAALTFNAGDNLTFTAGSTVQAVGSVTINVDQGADPDVGTGSTVTVAGTVISTVLAVVGGADPDTFNITPQTTANLPGISVNGNAPAFFTSPGDTLNYNTAAAASVDLNGPGNGVITSAGLSTLTYTNIENIAGGGATTVIIDADDDPASSPNNGVPDNFLVRKLTSGGITYLQVLVNTVVVFATAQTNYSNLDSLTLQINGSDDDDTLTVNHGVNGFVDATINFFAGAEGAGDAIAITGNPGAPVVARETYVVGATQDAGTWVLDRDGNRGPGLNVAGNGDELTINFTGLEPVDTDTPAAIFDVIMNVVANQATLQNGGLLNGAQSIQVVDNNASFETFRFANKTTTRIMGNSGADAFRLNATTNAAGLTTLELYGHIAPGVLGQPADDNSADVFEINATTATTTSLFGQGGDDNFHNIGFGPFGTGNFNLTNVITTLNIDGGTGANDQFALSDRDAAAADTNAVLTNAAITGVATGTVNYTAIDTFYLETTSQDDTISILSTQAGTNYLVTGDGGSDTITVGNASSDFAANTFDGSTDAIAGSLLLLPDSGNGSLGAADVINIDDSGSATGITGSISSIGNTVFTFQNGEFVNANTTELAGFASGATSIRYFHDNLNGNFYGGLPRSTRLETLNVRTSTVVDTIAVNATTATNTTTLDTREANDVVTIAGDALSANNTFQGFSGNDAFTLNIAANIGATAFAPIASLTIAGQDPAADGENRDRLTINDSSPAARFLNYQYLTSTQGDLDIQPVFAGSGLFGPVNLNLQVRTMETVIFNGDGSNNDFVNVTGSTDSEVIAVAQLATVTQALVFLDGDIYTGAPPADLTLAPPHNLPGVAGGSAGPDIRINGITPASGLFVSGGGIPAGGGDRAVVYAASENNLLSGGTLDPFGFGAGVLIPGFGVGNAYDTIAINDTGVTTTNNSVGALLPVLINTVSFIQGTPPSPAQQAAFIVNAGDEAVAQASGISDNITATVSTNFNIQVNGNLPNLVLGPDGLPVGDQLNITGPGSLNIFSDKATPPNVTVTFSGNPSPFGITNSSIERLLLSPGNGIVNLIGDNNDPAVDQNDNFVVRGRDIDAGGSLDAGVNEMTVQINGSAPILIDNVNKLNVYGDDQNPAPGTPSVGPNDIDTLDISAYADNADNLGSGHPPRGWGVDVTFNEGNPPGADGDQADLIIFHTSVGFPVPPNFYGGGSVSENIVVQPSGPDNGEIRNTNATDGSVIVIVQYAANTDIIFADDDGSPSDTDTLTLNGTDPQATFPGLPFFPQASGQDSVVADFTAAGDLANPIITVTDAANGSLLYRVRDFVGFHHLTFNLLGGDDDITVFGRFNFDSVNMSGLVINGGDGNDTFIFDNTNGQSDMQSGITVHGGTGLDQMRFQGTLFDGGTIYTPGPNPDEGTIVHLSGGEGGVEQVSFTGLEPILDITPSFGAIVQGTNANNTFNYSQGPNSGSTEAGNAVTGQVSVDGFEPYEFANKGQLLLAGLAGSDTFNLNNLTTPQFLASISVSGGDPVGGSDTLIVAGSPDADPGAAGIQPDAITVTPTDLDAATIDLVLDPAGINVSLPRIFIGLSEKLIIDGRGGDDLLTVMGDGFDPNNTTADVFIHTPGATRDSGHIAQSSTTIVAPLTTVNLLGVNYQNLGVAGTVAINGGSVLAGDIDSLTVLGTGGADTLNARFTAQNAIAASLTDTAGVHVAVTSVAVENYELRTLESADIINLQAPIDVTGTFSVFGGGPSGGIPAGTDVLTLLGAAGTDEVVGIAPSAINPLLQSITGLGGAGGATIVVGEVEAIGYVAVPGGAGDNLTVTTGNQDDTARLEGGLAFDVVTSNTLPTVAFTGVNNFVLNMVAGIDAVTVNPSFLQNALTYQVQASLSDTVNFEGAQDADLWTLTNPAGADLLLTDNSAAHTNAAVSVLTVGGGLAGVNLNTLGGDDTVTVNVAGAASDVIGNELTYDGGTGRDTLIATGTPVTAVNSVTYTPGPSNNQGRLLYQSLAPATLMTINFLNLEPVIDLVVAASLVVNGTNADNAINYTAGTVAGNGLVSVDAFETIEFANKQTLTINALAGDDVVHLANPNTPTALTGITVNGGDPTASDKLIVNGTAGNDTINYSVGGLGGGTVLVNALPLVTFTTTEALTIDGQGGTDALTITTLAGADTLYYTPGAVPDAGHIDVRRSGAGGGTSRTPLEFAQIGANGTVTFANTGGTREDALILNGTAAAETFNVTTTTVRITQFSLPSNPITNVINPTGISGLTLLGHDGDDSFSIPGNHPFTSGVFVDGGNPGASDTLTYTGTGSDVSLNLQAAAIVQTGSPVVGYSGIEIINLVASGAATTTTITATTTDDDLTVTPFSLTSGKVQTGLAVQQSGQVAPNVVSPLINYSN
ncbi:MAG: hypothetical protein SFU86_03405, partial [Pirellulaceae bacterium]|nr:hypothetical protein [Pirellulaceae bacterium]